MAWFERLGMSIADDWTAFDGAVARLLGVEGSLSSQAQGVMVLVCLALFALIWMLVVFVAALRGYHALKRAYVQRKEKLWREVLFAYLSDAATPHQMAQLLFKWDLPLFGRFISPYLEDIQGEDRNKLIGLLQRLRFDRFMLAWTRHPNEYDRAFAVRFLGLMEKKEYLPRLRPLIHSPFLLVRYHAAWTLMHLQDRPSVWPVVKRFSQEAGFSQDKLVMLLTAYGPAVLPQLVEILRGSNLSVGQKSALVRVLQQYHCKEMIWDLVQMAQTASSYDLKLHCMSALINLEEPLLVPFFEGMLDESRPEVKALAAKALERLGQDRSAPLLLPLLTHTDFWVVYHAACALGNMRPGRDMLKEERGRSHSPMVRRVIDEVLAKGGRP